MSRSLYDARENYIRAHYQIIELGCSDVSNIKLSTHAETDALAMLQIIRYFLISQIIFSILIDFLIMLLIALNTNAR